MSSFTFNEVNMLNILFLINELRSTYSKNKSLIIDERYTQESPILLNLCWQLLYKTYTNNFKFH